MKDIQIAELESNTETIFEELSDGEIFMICNEENQPLAVLVPYDEYMSLMQSDI